MKIKICLAFLSIFLIFTNINAQEKKTEISKTENYVFFVEIDEESGMKVRVQESVASENFGSLNNYSRTADFFEGFSSVKSKNKANVSVIVKSDVELPYENLLNTLRTIRNQSFQNVQLQIEDFYVFIPRQISKKEVKRLKPNPLTLLLKADKSESLFLNNEPFGNLSDTTKLTEKLKEVFKQREGVGAFREGTNIIETTVIIRTSDSIKFIDLINLIKAVKGTGSDKISLLIYDFNDGLLDPYYMSEQTK